MGIGSCNLRSLSQFSICCPRWEQCGISNFPVNWWPLLGIIFLRQTDIYREIKSIRGKICSNTAEILQNTLLLKVETKNCQLPRFRNFHSAVVTLDNEVITSLTCYLLLCPFYEPNLWQKSGEWRMWLGSGQGFLSQLRTEIILFQHSRRSVTKCQ